MKNNRYATLFPKKLLSERAGRAAAFFRRAPLKKVWLALIGGAVAFSCSDHDAVPSHDPSQAIVIDSITPPTGGMADDLFIYGKNFSVCPDSIGVTINGKKAAVIGSTLDRIYAVVPKRPETNGNVIVTIGGASSNPFPFIYRTAEVAQTLAGTGVSGDADGAGEKAQFNFSDMPGICFAPDGRLIVADCGNGKVKAVSEIGEVKTLVSGLSKPMDVTYDAEGNLYIANCDGMNIVRVGTDKKQKVVGKMDWPTAIAYDETTDRIVAVLYSGANIMALVDKNAEAAAGTNMEVFMPTNGIHISFMRFNGGDLYFTSSNRHAIYVLRKGASEPEVIAGVPGQQGVTLQETDAAEALLTNPCGLDFAPNGDLYFSSGTTTRAASADNKLYLLRKKDNKVVPFIGKKEAGNADGGASSAMFDSPAALRIDAANSVYVVDKRNYKIRKITVQ